MCCTFHIILFWVQCPTYCCRVCYYVLRKGFGSTFLLKLHKTAGGFIFVTSKYMVTFYFKMLLFICKGGVLTWICSGQRWGHYLLECTLNASFLLSFASDTSAVFSVKSSPGRPQSKRESQGFMQTLYIHVFLVFAFSFHLLLTLDYFSFPLFFFSS